MSRPNEDDIANDDIVRQLRRNMRAEEAEHAAERRARIEREREAAD